MVILKTFLFLFRSAERAQYKNKDEIKEQGRKE
jgi:hypothetical protein